MRRILFVSTLALFLAGLSTNPTAAHAANPDHKVLICHIPPGNPENWHEISVDDNAVPAHLAHGDQLGSCVILQAS